MVLPVQRVFIKIPVIADISRFVLEEDTHKMTASEEDKKTKDEKKKSDNSTTEEKISTVLQKSDKAGSSYMDDILFLGDSRIVGFQSFGYFGTKQMLAIVGLSHVDAQNKSYYIKDLGYNVYFKSYIESVNYPYIYIGYGINGVGFLDETVYKDSYRELVDNVKSYAPNSKIVLMSILPVIEGYSMTSKITNTEVDSYNVFLKNLAKEKGIYYLDLQEVMKNDDDSLRSEYCVGDGIHFNERAYTIIDEYILTHRVPELKGR